MPEQTMIPAEVFHASDVIAEECIARGWSLWDFAKRIGALDAAMTVLEWQFYAIREPDILMGNDGAMDLERVLGISAELWLRTETNYRQHANSRSSLGPHIHAWYGLDQPAEERSEP